MHLWLAMALAAVLAGAGTYGILARRNAVLVLIGVELVLNAANLVLVAVGAADDSSLQTGQVLTLFVITIAAAEICVALGVVLAMFRLNGHIDLTTSPQTEDSEDSDDSDDPDDPEAPGVVTASTEVRR
jgi:NADH-quinone oxidoreductase subunit K